MSDSKWRSLGLFFTAKETARGRFLFCGNARKTKSAFTVEDKCFRPSLFLCRGPAKENVFLGVLACPVKCRLAQPCEAGFHQGSLGD